MLTRNLVNNRIGVRITQKYASENENGKGRKSFGYLVDVRNRFAVALVQFFQHPFEV